MPNWCEGDLYVYGPRKELEKFRETFETTRENKTFLDFEKAVPDPLADIANATDEELVIATMQGRSGEEPYSYGFRINNWGTRGMDEDTQISVAGKHLLYSFMTAWSPPLPVILKMGEKFPKLRLVFNYYEGGMGFSGKLEIRGGKVTKDEYDNSYRGHRGG